ncbi:TetR/AcrR family transcriptional regulator [Streptomyces sp. NPDC006743]|uniref:TetR/AcrR family transcriptional regulator n=1 Tax=Streptomyces sp. NPDC006743 TaxID=3154480 RepID=UPI003456100B
MAKKTATAASQEPKGAVRPRSRERRTVRQEAAVDAAFRLAAREGVTGLSMRRLAQELDVDVTALYRLFRDKDELLLALCERIIETELDAVGEVPEDEPWTDTLRRIAAVMWQSQSRFPAVTVLTFARTTGGPAERRMIELLLSCFTRSGLPPAEAVLYYRTFVDTALGHCASAASLSSLDPEAREKDDTTWTRVYARLPEGDYPVTHAHVTELSVIDHRTIYDTAVEAVLAAAARTAAGA